MYMQLPNEEFSVYGNIKRLRMVGNERVERREREVGREGEERVSACVLCCVVVVG